MSSSCSTRSPENKVQNDVLTLVTYEVDEKMMPIVDGRIEPRCMLRENEQTGAWSELADYLSVHEVGPKHGEAFVPVRFAWQGAAALNRTKDNVAGASAFVMLDSDGLSELEARRLWQCIEIRGLDAVAYSTHSHGRADKAGCRFRLAIRLDREQTADEIKAVRKGCAEYFGEMLDVEAKRVFDPAAMSSAHMFLMPRRDAARDSFVWRNDGGRALPVDRVLSLVPVEAAPQRAPVDGAVTGTPEQVAAAQSEVDSLAAKIRRCTTGLRKYTAQATYTVGQYVAAGLLSEADVLDLLEDAVRGQRAAHGDRTCTLQDRFAQLREGIEQGIDKGPLFPATETTLGGALGRVDHRGKLAVQLRGAVPAEVLSAAQVLEQVALRPRHEVQALPPGTGKSRRHLAIIAADDKPANVFVPRHELGTEHVARLVNEMGVPTSDVGHDRSPLAPVPGRPSCLLRAKDASFAAHVRDNHLNLKRSVCTRCPHRPVGENGRGGDGTCEAIREQPSEARIVLAAHQAFRTSVNVDRAFASVVFDEEPDPFVRAVLSDVHLDEMAASDAPTTAGGRGLRFWTLVAAHQGAALRQAARALRDGVELDADVLERVRGYQGQLIAARDRGTSPQHWSLWPWFANAARALMLMYSEGAEVQRAQDSRIVIAETEAYKAIISGDATLLSATPTPGAYSHVWRPALADGCAGIVRELHYLAQSTKASLQAHDGGPRLDRLAPVLETIRERCAGKRVLVVIESWLEKFLRDHPELLPETTYLAHHGNVAGLNIHEVGAALEVDAVVTIGDYRPGNRWTFEYLARKAGLQGQAFEEEVERLWAQHASDQLAQAHGRARDPWRTKPVLHMHFGRLPVTGWHAENTTVFEAPGEPAHVGPDALAVLLEKLTQTEVASILDVDRSLVGHWATGSKLISSPHRVRLAEVANSERFLSLVPGVTKRQKSTPCAIRSHSGAAYDVTPVTSEATPLTLAVRALGSVRKVADLLGTSKAAVSEVLSGKRSQPETWGAKLATLAPTPRRPVIRMRTRAELERLRNELEGLQDAA